MTSSAEHQAQPKLLSVGALCDVVDANTGNSYAATVLSRRWGSSSNPPPASADTDNLQYYIHRHDQDKRMDGWVDHASVRPALESTNSDIKTFSTGYSAASLLQSTPVKGANGSSTSSSLPPHSIEKGKRKADHDLVHEGSDGSRTPSTSRQASPALPDRSAHHRPRHNATASSSDTPALRNIDRVLYGNFDIKTWYYSPYPLDHDDDGQDGSTASSSASAILAANKRHQSPSSLRVGAASSATTKRAPRKDGASSLGGALSSSARDAPAIKSLASGSADSPSRQSPSSHAASNNARSKKDIASPTKMLWVCDGCFKYMKTYNGFAAHRKFCRNTHPPGRKVYQRGAHIIWEVDGATEKLYCQNLSLFGKLFIDHKTIYFDVEPFLFYVLTDAANASFDHPLGFFSKEKISYDDYNLACIVTFPPFQRKSFGTLMIEFSYYLSAGQGMLGTPERPLSDLGFKGYLSFWTAVLLRALAECFDGPIKKTAAVRHRRSSSAVKSDAMADGAQSDSKTKGQDALRRWHILAQRCKLLNIPLDSISHQPGFAELQQLAAEADTSQSLNTSTPTGHKRKLRLKGWAGSTPSHVLRQQNVTAATAAAAAAEEGEVGAARRSSRVAANGNADAPTADKGTIHPALDISTLEEDAACTMAVTVESLSRLTHLRADDIVLALSEAGLADAASTPFLPVTDEAVTQHSGAMNGGVDKDSGTPTKPIPTLALLLTRDAIRQAITRFNIRPAVLDPTFALM
ncbi:related to histone acetyltransferase [Ustilago trichophora]|uniref:histone acetyltransferase n=1 Tax=Ustilago trichophora TaxID=86804 RepID=A0A5C3DWF2_9BASI|nr:related to histone acetyltransferase [Ustilago trichophora]